MSKEIVRLNNEVSIYPKGCHVFTSTTLAERGHMSVGNDRNVAITPESETALREMLNTKEAERRFEWVNEEGDPYESSRLKSRQGDRETAAVAYEPKGLSPYVYMGVIEQFASSVDHYEMHLVHIMASKWLAEREGKSDT